MKNKALVSFRKHHSITQYQMARALNIPYRTYQDWELGYKIPSAPSRSLLDFALHSPEFLKKIKKMRGK